MLFLEETKRKCVAGKTYYDGCNNCFCAGDNVACTQMFCTDKNGKAAPRIEPPEDFWQKE